TCHSAPVDNFATRAPRSSIGSVVGVVSTAGRLSASGTSSSTLGMTGGATTRGQFLGEPPNTRALGAGIANLLAPRRVLTVAAVTATAGTAARPVGME